MSAFRTPLIYQDDGGFPVTLAAMLVYQSDLLKCALYIPLGFQTDLASIPRPLWAVLPKVGKWDAAGVVHDWLYQRNGITRQEADAVFHEAMLVKGVGPKTAALMWLGVRVGGWKPWNAYRKAEQEMV